jgi:hypothetical protein
MRAEIDNHRLVGLDQDDRTEAVLVVGHLITNGELLDGRIHVQDIEGTSGQEAPGRGAGRLHHYQYAPRSATGPSFLSVRMPRGGDAALQAVAGQGRPVGWYRRGNSP